MSTARAVRAFVPAAMVCTSWCGALACTRERVPSDESLPPHPVPRAAPPQAADRASLNEYEVGPGPVDLAFGSRRQLHGRLQLARGRLWLDASDLSATRAELIFDLGSLIMEGAPSSALAGPTGGASLTEQSLDWLEIREPSQLAAHPERRYARFEVTSVAAVAVNDARGGQPVFSPPAVVRQVGARATGQLELHGYRLPYTVGVVATFTWAEPAPLGGPPSRVELATAEPVPLDVLRHDVVPRDSRGDIQGDVLARLRKLPSNTVQVSGRWVAELVEGRSLR